MFLSPHLKTPDLRTIIKDMWTTTRGVVEMREGSREGWGVGEGWGEKAENCT